MSTFLDERKPPACAITIACPSIHDKNPREIGNISYSVHQALGKSQTLGSPPDRRRRANPRACRLSKEHSFLQVRCADHLYLYMSPYWVDVGCCYPLECFGRHYAFWMLDKSLWAYRALCKPAKAAYIFILLRDSICSKACENLHVNYTYLHSWFKWQSKIYAPRSLKIRTLMPKRLGDVAMTNWTFRPLRLAGKTGFQSGDS